MSDPIENEIISSEEKQKFSKLMAELAKEMEENPIIIESEMEFPLTVDNLNIKVKPVSIGFRQIQPGTLVKIRPCAEEYQKKTYLGIYLGDLMAGVMCAFRPKTQQLDIISNNNPAIFVPDLKRIIWGMESWWGEIKTEDEIKDITDDDIANVWYVKILKSQLNNQK